MDRLYEEYQNFHKNFEFGEKTQQSFDMFSKTLNLKFTDKNEKLQTQKMLQLTRGGGIIGFVIHSRRNSNKIEAFYELKKLHSAWRLGLMLRWWMHHPCHYDYDREMYLQMVFEKLKIGWMLFRENSKKTQLEEIIEID